MRIPVLLAFYFFLTISGYSQEITGQWNGLLKVQGTQLRLVFHIEETEDGYKSTMDSPDQAAFGIPVTSTSFENGTLKIAITNANIRYEGSLEKEKIIGVFNQSGQSFPMNLSRTEVQAVEVKRPQEPTEPYPYSSEDLYFENKNAGIKLAGTLTMPTKGSNFPAVVLISGSGPQNRNEELMGHKPFLVLSDYLTKNGIAVLRFDDRGTAASEGDFGPATSADFATDVAAAVDYLKTRSEINSSQIGLIGHSEGGIIAPMVANSKPQDVDFIVLLAGTGIRGDQLLLLQQALIGKASGMSPAQLEENDMISRQAFEIMLKDLNSEDLQQEIVTYMTRVYRNIPPENVPNGMTEADFVAAQVKQLTSPWMSSFIKYDPATALEKVACPVLAINGEKDLQVPPKENLEAIKAALEKGGNPDITTVELAGLNHLFQEAATGTPSEYGTIEQTFAPAAMEVVLNWIKERVE